MRIHTSNKQRFFLSSQPPQFGSGFSIANPDVIDLNLFPDISKVEWTYSTVGPGDCIYIPSGKYALFSLNYVFLSVSLNQHQSFYSTLSSQTQNSDQSPMHLNVSGFLPCYKNDMR